MGFAALLATGLVGVAACSDDDGGTNQNDGGTNQNDAAPDAEVIPPEVCGDASDNDGDGLTDCRDPDCAAEAACTVAFTLVQTSDLHAHAGGYHNAMEYTPTTTADNDPTLGGYARIAAVINGVKTAKAATSTPVLLVDTGDWHAGTIFDWSAGSDPITLRFFQMMGYTAMTFGNHDLDWTPDGLAMMLNNAVTATPAFGVPAVQTNIVFDATDTGDDNLAAFETAGLIRRKLVVDLPNGLKVGFLGRMGDEPAGQSALAPPVTWEATDPAGANFASYWQGKVDDLRNNDGVDVVIMLSHGQIALTGTSEDRTLANLVDGIDFIAAGHSHVFTPDPILVGSTMIFSPFSYGQYVSQLDVTFNLANGTVDSSALTMHEIDDTVTGDATVAGMVDMYVAGINAQLMTAMPVGYASPIAQFDEVFDITMVENSIGENAFGNLVADAFRTVATISVFQATENAPFDVAVVPAGSIRDGLYHGNSGMIAFADAYAALSTGMSPFDQSMPGWPLVSIYLYRAELRDAAEVNALVSSGMASAAAQLYFSGMRYKTDAGGGMFNTVWQVSLCGNALRTSYGGDGDFHSLNCSPLPDVTDETVLYRVVVDLYTYMMLGLAAESSFGNLSIVPKDAAGDPITNIGTALIDRLPLTGGMQELKEWMTLPAFFTDWTNIGAFVPGGAYMLPQIPEAVYGAAGTCLGRAMEEAAP